MKTSWRKLYEEKLIEVPSKEDFEKIIDVPESECLNVQKVEKMKKDREILLLMAEKQKYLSDILVLDTGQGTFFCSRLRSKTGKIKDESIVYCDNTHPPIKDYGKNPWRPLSIEEEEDNTIITEVCDMGKGIVMRRIRITKTQMFQTLCYALSVHPMHYADGTYGVIG